MHGLKQRDGKFIVRIFGVNDNPKENRLFGMDLEQIEKDLDMKLWPDDSHTLWSAALYPEADTIEEAVSAALNLYAIVHGEEQPFGLPLGTEQKSRCRKQQYTDRADFQQHRRTDRRKTRLRRRRRWLPSGHPEKRRHQTAGRRTSERSVHGQPGWSSGLQACVGIRF